MDRWDVLIILVAGYLAVMALVRMMARRRNELVDHVHKQIKDQQGQGKSVKKSTDEAGKDAA